MVSTVRLPLSKRMSQYQEPGPDEPAQRWGTFREDRHGYRSAFPEESEMRNRYLLIATVCFTECAEDYDIGSGDALVTNFCRVGVPRDLHSNQASNFESRFMQEVLERLCISKTRSSHPWRSSS